MRTFGHFFEFLNSDRVHLNKANDEDEDDDDDDDDKEDDDIDYNIDDDEI